MGWGSVHTPTQLWKSWVWRAPERKGFCLEKQHLHPSSCWCQDLLQKLHLGACKIACLFKKLLGVIKNHQPPNQPPLTCSTAIKRGTFCFNSYACLAQVHILPSSQRESICVNPALVWKQLMCPHSREGRERERPACTRMCSPGWNCVFLEWKSVSESLLTHQTVLTPGNLTGKQGPNPDAASMCNISQVLWAPEHGLLTTTTTKQLMLWHTHAWGPCLIPAPAGTQSHY